MSGQQPPPPVTPALAYFHIPTPEYNAAFTSPSMLVGEKQEATCSASVNSGLFTSLVESGDVKATFVGHDHVNDYCGNHLGIHLCYGGGIGYHTYGYVVVAHIVSGNPAHSRGCILFSSTYFCIHCTWLLLVVF